MIVCCCESIPVCRKCGHALVCPVVTDLEDRFPGDATLNLKPSLSKSPDPMCLIEELHARLYGARSIVQGDVHRLELNSCGHGGAYLVMIVSPPDARYAPLGRANKAPPEDIAVLVLPVLAAFASQLQEAEVS